MSVTFRATREDRRPLAPCTCEDGTCAVCVAELNMSNVNAADLLLHVKLPLTDELIGQLPAAEVGALCEARLAKLEIEPAIMAKHLDERVFLGGRRAGYLREKTAELLALARRAGDMWVSWG